jgi:hypothetical protein
MRAARSRAKAVCGLEVCRETRRHGRRPHRWGNAIQPNWRALQLERIPLPGHQPREIRARQPLQEAEQRLAPPRPARALDSTLSMRVRPSMALLWALAAVALGCRPSDRIGQGDRTGVHDAATGNGDASATAEAGDTHVTADASGQTGADAAAQVEDDAFYHLNDAGCLEVDLSTFDRSCDADSDCAVVATVFCPGVACPSAEIRVEGLARFNEVFSHLPPNPRGVRGECGPLFSLAQACLYGVCTYPSPN